VSTQAAPRPIPGARQRRRPTVPVFNPTDIHDDVQSGGRYYHFAPESYTLIEDMWEWPRDQESNAILWGQPREIPKGCDAYSIAEMIVADRIGRNYIILEGDKNDWSEQMAEARSAWIEMRKAECEAEISSWESTVARKAAEGMALPVPPKWVERAYADRSKYQTIGIRDFPCPVCGKRFIQEHAIPDHIRERHPLQAATYRKAVEPPPAAEGEEPPPPPMRELPPRPERPKPAAAAPAPVEPPPPPQTGGATAEADEEDDGSAVDVGAPEAAMAAVATKPATKADVSEAGEDLIARAVMLKVELSGADKKLLRAGDTETLTEVAAKLTQAQGRKKRS
jgi:hypothetical protein